MTDMAYIARRSYSSTLGSLAHATVSMVFYGEDLEISNTGFHAKKDTTQEHHKDQICIADVFCSTSTAAESCTCSQTANVLASKKHTTPMFEKMKTSVLKPGSTLPVKPVEPEPGDKSGSTYIGTRGNNLVVVLKKKRKEKIGRGEGQEVSLSRLGPQCH
ncbi:hypothetical protein LXL04_035774 [Taraxacum kok-saghyz]